MDERDLNGKSQILKCVRRLSPNGLVTGEHWRMSFSRVQAAQRTVACGAGTGRPKFVFFVHAHGNRFFLDAFLFEGLAQQILRELNWHAMPVMCHQINLG